MKLKDLLEVSFEDIHLCHMDEEHDVSTIVSLNKNTLTEHGKTEWADVLDSDVHRIYYGYYGIQLDVDGVEPQRLADFSSMLAGYCSEKYYNQCVNEEPDPPQPIINL